MSKFIRTIGRCAINGISFDIYQNKNNTATIRPVKFGHDMPKTKWHNFDNLEELQNFIDNHDSDNLTPAGLVQKLKEVLL